PEAAGVEEQGQRGAGHATGLVGGGEPDPQRKERRRAHLGRPPPVHEVVVEEQAAAAVPAERAEALRAQLRRSLPWGRAADAAELVEDDADVALHLVEQAVEGHGHLVDQVARRPPEAIAGVEAASTFALTARQLRAAGEERGVRPVVVLLAQRRQRP